MSNFIGPVKVGSVTTDPSGNTMIQTVKKDQTPGKPLLITPAAAAASPGIGGALAGIQAGSFIKYVADFKTSPGTGLVSQLEISEKTSSAGGKTSENNFGLQAGHATTNAYSIAAGIGKADDDEFVVSLAIRIANNTERVRQALVAQNKTDASEAAPVQQFQQAATTVQAAPALQQVQGGPAF